MIRARDLHALPVEDDLAGIFGHRPAQDLDQGRLPGAVLAEQDVHLTPHELQRDVVERDDARELLADAAHLQDRRLLVHWRGRVGCMGQRGRITQQAPPFPLHFDSRQ